MSDWKACLRMTASSLALAAGTALAIHQGASAQTAATTAPVATPSANTLQEVIVTANRRVQNLQDVGISVTALSGQQLKSLGFTNAVDIIRQIPSLNILASSASNTNISVRGVSQNDFADHYEGPIAVYSDDGYLGTSGAINGQIFDLQRVEALRGPQGTLFGRNATGGLIQYISNPPTDHFDAYGQVDFGQRNLFQYETAVGGPINDHVRMRLSLAGIHEDGYVQNLVGPRPGNQNNFSGRLQAVIDLTPKTQLRLMLNGNGDSGERGLAGQSVAAVANANGQAVALGPNQIGSWANIVTGGTITGTCPGCDILGYKQPSDVFTRAYSDPGTFQKDIGHGQAKLTSNLGWANLTSVTDYLYLRKNFLNQDVDGGPSQFFRFNTREQYHQFSQELRLDGVYGRLKWVAGFYYLNVRGEYNSSVLFDVSRYVGAPVCGTTPGFACPTTTPGVVGTSENHYRVDVDSYSGFGQAEYALGPKVSLIGGLRFTRDDKTADYVWDTNAISGLAPTVYNPSTDPTARERFNMVSAKGEIDYRPIEHTLTYFSYSRGVKGGSWAFPVFPPPITSANFASFPDKAEVLTDLETGVKTEFWDRRARLNVGGFFYHYHDYQAFSLAGLAQSIFNKNADAFGGEAEFVVNPLRGLQISLGASSMTSRVYDVQYPTGGTFTAQLPFASKFSYNGLVRYGWDAFGGEMAVQTAFTSIGPHYFDVANEPFVHEKRYFTDDSRVSYSAGSGHWNVAFWVKNMTDATYRTFALDLAALSFGDQDFAPPRQFGATVGYKY